MLKLIDFSNVALHVYHDTKQNAQHIGAAINPTPRSSKVFAPDVIHQDGVYEIILDRNVQSNPKHGFYASLYIKVEGRKATGAIMAIRGTVPTNVSNDMVDASTWWPSIFDDNATLQVPLFYQRLAHAFMQRVTGYCLDTLKMRRDQVFVTGHSLGGALAALITSFCDFNLRTVTFNAPGIKDMIGVDNAWERVLNIRSAYDFVSAIDYPVGPVKSFHVKKHESAAREAFSIERKHKENGWTRLDIIHDVIELKDFTASALSQHSMANLLEAMLTSPYRSDAYSFINHQMHGAYAKREHYKLVSPFAKHEHDEYVSYETSGMNEHGLSLQTARQF